MGDKEIKLIDKKKARVIGAVIDYKWRTARDSVGVVAVSSYGGWKAYIGVGKGLDEDSDVSYIINHGAKLLQHEAIAFFPRLDPKECEN